MIHMTSWVQSARRRREPAAAGPSLSQAPKLYEIAYDFLRSQIVEGHMPARLVLLEGPIADLLDMSRAPVKRALELLRRDGVIERFDGRGYLVGPVSPDSSPLRLDLATLDLVLPAHADPSLPLRSTWERIYSDVEMAVASCTPFGTYRIVETAIGEHFAVSRTVVREVLSRLRDRGLIEKDPRSHWIAGPLTAKAITEHYEMRKLLEPAALAMAAPALDRDQLLGMRDRLIAAETESDSLTAEIVDRFEQDLHIDCVLQIRNRRLAATIVQNQLPFITNHMFRRYLGVRGVEPILAEHRRVVEHLMHGSGDAAAAALEAHLEASHQRTRARLKVLSVFPEPATPPYLMRIH